VSWYDYIPGVRSISRLADGDYKGALLEQFSYGSPIGMGLKYGGEYAYDKWSDARDQQDSSLGNARNKLSMLAQDSKDFQLQGLKQAQGYFDPVDERINSLYGPPGSFKK
jgi:hypothetical protein